MKVVNLLRGVVSFQPNRVGVLPVALRLGAENFSTSSCLLCMSDSKSCAWDLKRYVVLTTVIKADNKRKTKHKEEHRNGNTNEYNKVNGLRCFVNNLQGKLFTK